MSICNTLIAAREHNQQDSASGEFQNTQRLQAGSHVMLGEPYDNLSGSSTTKENQGKKPSKTKKPTSHDPLRHHTDIQLC